MHRTILTSVMFVLILLVCLSSASRSIVVSAQATPGVEGNWRGALDVGAVKLRLVVKISKSADGKLAATMDSLDQNAKDLVVDTITFQDGALNFEMKALSATYAGTLNKDGSQLTGKFTQGWRGVSARFHSCY